MIINSTSLTGITSICRDTGTFKHITFGASFLNLLGTDIWQPNNTLDTVTLSVDNNAYNYHGSGWGPWCRKGQVAGSILLQGGSSIDRPIEDNEYAFITTTSSSITLIDITCSMSYHAGGLNTAATHVYNFSAYNRIIYNSSGTPSVLRNNYYGNGSGSGSLDTGNFTIVVVSGRPCFRFTPASSSTSTATMFNYVGQVVQSI